MNLIDKIKESINDISFRKSNRENNSKTLEYWNSIISYNELKEFIDLVNLLIECEYDYMNSTRELKLMDDSWKYRWNSHINGKRKIKTLLNQYVRKPQDTIETLKDNIQKIGKNKEINN